MVSRGSPQNLSQRQTKNAGSPQNDEDPPRIPSGSPPGSPQEHLRNLGRNLPQTWQNQRSASKANRKLVSNLPESGGHETQLAIRARSLSLLAVFLAGRSLGGCLVGAHLGVIQCHVLFDIVPCGSRALQAFATMACNACDMQSQRTCQV